MADSTQIEWTDSTWNPITGCTKITSGCDFCYAERFAERFRGVPGHPFENGFDLTLRPDRLSQPLRWRQPRRIFVNSMSDLFHKEVPFSFVHSVFDTMEMADWHTYQVLTKRSSLMARFLRQRYANRLAPPHIWLGVSIEDAKNCVRLRHLQSAPVSLRFVSFEPLLGPVGKIDLAGIDWAIVGGESGPRARPMYEEWAVEIRDQCRAAGVAFFFKQWGGVRPKTGGRLLRDREWNEYPNGEIVSPVFSLGGLPVARKGRTESATTPKSTVWELQPHTAAKHEILRRYLDAWVPILSQGKFPHLVIVDGFAGPGRYSKGESGSPIIAIEAVTEQRRPVSAKVDFHFIELDTDRAAHLEQEVAVLDLPANVSTQVHARAFQDAFPDVWDSYAPKGKKPRPPSFVFIDPFGFKIPFRNVAAVLRERSCEVLVNFMFEEINRFLSHERQPDNFDALFGCQDWRQGIALKKPSDRTKFLHDLYQRQLIEAAGASYVRSFAMRNEKNAMDYFLFFATNNELGLRKMKHAMWRVDQSGTYSFSDATDPNQSVMFGAEPDRDLLKRQILTEFSGKRTTPKKIEQFVVTRTAFLDTHYKKVLQGLEQEGALVASGAPAGRRRGTYGDENLVLEFIARPAARKA